MAWGVLRLPAVVQPCHQEGVGGTLDVSIPNDKMFRPQHLGMDGSCLAVHVCGLLKFAGRLMQLSQSVVGGSQVLVVGPQRLLLDAQRLGPRPLV